MKKRNIIRPTGLKGNDQLNRMRELMGNSNINENVNRYVVELTKMGPDGKVYGIVRENQEYYIKVTDKTKNIVAEDFQYMGGLMNKKSKSFPSYAKAIKNLNLKFMSLKEAIGESGQVNIFKNDNLLKEHHPLKADMKLSDTKGIGDGQEYVVNKKGSKLSYDNKEGKGKDGFGDNVAKKDSMDELEDVKLNETESFIDEILGEIMDDELPPTELQDKWYIEDIEREQEEYDEAQADAYLSSMEAHEDPDHVPFEYGIDEMLGDLEQPAEKKKINERFFDEALGGLKNSLFGDGPIPTKLDNKLKNAIGRAYFDAMSVNPTKTKKIGLYQDSDNTLYYFDDGQKVFVRSADEAYDLIEIFVNVVLETIHGRGIMNLKDALKMVSTSAPKGTDGHQRPGSGGDIYESNIDVKSVLKEMRFDERTTGLFEDEEEDYNLDEEKYVVKVDAPEKEEDIFGGEEDSLDSLEDMGDDEPMGDDKPFDDEPFDAGVEADEDEDPEKFIQQLAGKIGTSLRSYTNERGEPDLELEKYVINSVISATHTSEMDEEDQKDIIKKVKMAGAGSDVDDKDIEADEDEKPEEEELDIDVEMDDSEDESKDELDELKESANVFKHLSLKKKDK